MAISTYTIIISKPNTSGENIYDTGDGCVELREVERESSPAVAYEVVEKTAQQVAEARGWEKA